jgi:hypothetical protein
MPEIGYTVYLNSDTIAAPRIQDSRPLMDKLAQ